MNDVILSSMRTLMLASAMDSAVGQMSWSSINWLGDACKTGKVQIEPFEISRCAKPSHLLGFKTFQFIAYFTLSTRFSEAVFNISLEF